MTASPVLKGYVPRGALDRKTGDQDSPTEGLLPLVGSGLVSLALVDVQGLMQAVLTCLGSGQGGYASTCNG